MHRKIGCSALARARGVPHQSVLFEFCERRCSPCAYDPYICAPSTLDPFADFSQHRLWSVTVADAPPSAIAP